MCTHTLTRILRPRTAGGALRPAAWTWALLATALPCALATTAKAQAADKRAPWANERGVDASIRPGDDFFGYANGDWLKATAIPAGKDRWGTRAEIAEQTRLQIAELLDDARTAPVGSNARKVADFRAAYLNEAVIEARGLGPLRPMLDNIERMQDKAALARLLGKGVPADVDPLNWAVYTSSHLLGLSIEEGNNGETHHVAYLLQGGLGLGDRERYLGSEPSAQALRTVYQEYIGRLLSLVGFDHADQRAAAVMALETAIAKSHATSEFSANDHNADNLWTRADFAREAPGMDWAAFLAAAGLAKVDKIVAWQPSALKGAAALVASEPLPVWKDYLRVRLVHRYADVLPKAIAEQALAFRAATAGAPAPQSPRAQRALDATQLALSDAIGRMYVERHFPAEHKAWVQAIVANVITSLSARVERVTWMSPATRTIARAKLKTLYFGMGYPEQWQDHSTLTIDPADALGNLRRVEDRTYRLALQRLGTPVDVKEWFVAPQTVGAVLTFQFNAYNFAAALLQAPTFDPSASDATNYGAIGAIAGHESSHFIDLLGAEYELGGRNRRWWTPDDLAQHEVAYTPLVNQISAYRPFPDVAVNAKQTLTENIADLGGLAAAFDAYRLTLGSRLSDTAYVRSQDREFFIAFARSWRSLYSDEALRAQLATDTHAPDRYRIATVRNLDAWYEAFDVRPGQKLYLEPSARVRVW